VRPVGCLETAPHAQGVHVERGRHLATILAGCDPRRLLECASKVCLA
jgi:hypothetical protein